MTVACVEALTLRDCLASGAEGLAGRFFRAGGKLIDIPSQIAIGSDPQRPGVVGERTLQVRLVNWHIARLYRGGRRAECGKTIRLWLPLPSTNEHFLSDESLRPLLQSTI
jgi:hypothetical protein